MGCWHGWLHTSPQYIHMDISEQQFFYSEKKRIIFTCVWHKLSSDCKGTTQTKWNAINLSQYDDMISIDQRGCEVRTRTKDGFLLSAQNTSQVQNAIPVEPRLAVPHCPVWFRGNSLRPEDYKGQTVLGKLRAFSSHGHSKTITNIKQCTLVTVCSL